MMHRLIILFAIVSTSCQFARGADPLRDSVVKIHSTLKAPNFARPWTKGNAQQISGSGVILTGNRILTNAHVVMYASRIVVQPNQSTERIPAKVEAIAPGIDLAVLKLSDQSLFNEKPALELAKGMPRIKDTVNAYGYPMGGEQLSVTEGIISRIEYTAFAYSTLGLRIQVDAALNPGNSGGPAVADGKVVGLVTSTIRSADNIGYLIATDEIRMFLKDIDDGKYDGKPKLRVFSQTVENSALRGKLGLPKSVGGLMVTRIPTDVKNCPLKPWDVISEIGGQALDNQGNIQVDDELRLSFQYLIPKLAKNDKIALTVFRDGKSLQVDMPVDRKSDRLIPYLKGSYPPHFICGPMVFSTPSQELLAPLNSRIQVLLGTKENPLISRRFQKRKFPGEELVILGPRMLSHPIMEGYDNQSLAVVNRVNGVAIKNLSHLVETVRDAKGKFITFELFGNYETMVFDRQELLDTTEQILEDEGIRYQMSEELRKTWESGK